MTRKIVIKEFDMGSLGNDAKLIHEFCEKLGAEVVVEVDGGLGWALKRELSKLRKLTGREILAALDVHNPSPELLDFVESMDPELNTVAGFYQTGRTTALLARMIFRLSNTDRKSAAYIKSSRVQSENISQVYKKAKDLLNVELPSVTFVSDENLGFLRGVAIDDAYLDLVHGNIDYWFINDLGFKNITMCIDSLPKSKITVLQ